MRRTPRPRRLVLGLCALVLLGAEVAASGPRDAVAPLLASRPRARLALSLERDSVVMAPGGRAEVIVSVAYRGGFTSTNTRLWVRALPEDVRGAFSPQPITHQGKAVLTLEGNANLSPGLHPLTVGATGAGRTSSRRLDLLVSDAPRFTLSLFPARQTLSSESVARYPVSVEPHAGFRGPVMLVARGLPPGARASFDPNPAPAGSTTVLSLSGMEASPGRHRFEVVGSAGVLSARAEGVAVAGGGRRSWRMRRIATVGAPINTILVGPGRDDGVNRVYAGTVSTGRVFEVSRSGSGWSEPVDIGGSADGQEIHNMGMGPGRNDGVTRIYACSTGGDLIELTYQGPGWSQETIGPRRGECYHALVGKGRNDGRNRVYAARGDGVWEYTRRRGEWREVSVGRVGGVAHGIALGKARGRRTRIYVASTERGTYEAGYARGSWRIVRLGDDGDIRNVSVGRGRRGGKRRVYAASSGGVIRELTWRNGRWSVGTTGDVGSIAIHAWVTEGRNDDVKRLYTATADGSGFEFTWTGSRWRSLRMGRADNYLYGMHFGRVGRNVRLFGGSFDGNVYQFRWR